MLYFNWVIVLKIIKYKKTTKGRYKVYLDDDRCLLLYEDVILKHNLLIKKELSEEEIFEAEKYNQECDVYYVGLNSINNRFKSVLELRKYLEKKEYPKDLIELAINKLLKQGYLNDRSFCKSYINNQIVTTTKGPYKIRRELRDKGIEENIIEDEIVIFDEELELEKVNKLADKMIRTNKSRGGSVLRKKITTDLTNMGYSTDIIYKVLSNYDFTSDKDIVKKEYDKLYKRLSRKYSDKELEYKIKEGLYKKGLYYED